MRSACFDPGVSCTVRPDAHRRWETVVWHRARGRRSRRSAQRRAGSRRSPSTLTFAARTGPGHTRSLAPVSQVTPVRRHWQHKLRRKASLTCERKMRRQPDAVPSRSCADRRRSPALARAQAAAANAADGSNDPTTPEVAGLLRASDATNDAPSERDRSRPQRTTLLDRSHQRNPSSQSELRVSVQQHPSPPLSVSPGRPTASKEGRIEPQPFTTSIAGQLATRRPMSES